MIIIDGEGFLTLREVSATDLPNPAPIHMLLDEVPVILRNSKIEYDALVQVNLSSDYSLTEDERERYRAAEERLSVDIPVIKSLLRQVIDRASQTGIQELYDHLQPQA